MLTPTGIYVGGVASATSPKYEREGNRSYGIQHTASRAEFVLPISQVDMDTVKTGLQYIKLRGRDPR